MKRLMFFFLILPLALFSQVPNIKKGKLQFEKDIAVHSAGSLSKTEVPTGKIGNLIENNLRYVRYNPDFSYFYFPFTAGQTRYFQQLNLSDPSSSDVFSLKTLEPSIYNGNTPVIGTYKPAAFDGNKYKGSSFLDLSRSLAYVAHVIVTEDKDWRFEGQSYYMFTDQQNRDQILYAALFSKGSKQVIKAWLVQDLPLFESLEEAGRRIARESFGSGEKKEETTNASLRKEVRFTTPNPKFVYEDEGAKERISSFDIQCGPAVSYLWLQLSRMKGDEKKFWFLSGNSKVDLEQALEKRPGFFSGRYLSDLVDRAGNFYLVEEQSEGKKTKIFLVKYNFTGGTKQVVGKYEINGDFYRPRVSLAPDGKFAAVYSEFHVNDNYVLDLGTGKPVFKLDIPSAKERRIKLNENNDVGKYAVNFSNDGNYLYVISSFTSKDIYGDYFSSVYLNTYRFKN